MNNENLLKGKNMLYQKYSERIQKKLEKLLLLYTDMMFETVDTMKELQGFVTTEHFRNIPVDRLTPLASGQKWGGEYGNLWISGSYTIPEELAGKKVFVRPVTGAHEIMFFKNGEPDGIFNRLGDHLKICHSTQLICKDAIPGESFWLAFECYAHHFVVGLDPYDCYGEENPTGGDFEKNFENIEICLQNEIVTRFVYDLDAVLKMAKSLGDDNYLKHRAQQALEQVFAVVIQYPVNAGKEELESSLEACLDYLAPCLVKGQSDSSRGEIAMVGHSHIDTSWLWPVSETVRKCARTYSNVFKLMEQYDDYRFVQSSALHSDWMRRYYPSIFENMKKYVAEGRYEPNGGVWVECDCNITSGELMARQFMYGQHFTRKYFNYTADCFWLPDTFGYNAAIPQIMLESEVKYFCTTKMSWNDLNEFPLTSFIWRGNDGSEVITHLHKIGLYPNPQDIMSQAAANKNKQSFSAKLFPFGEGDGGGGPTVSLLEQAKRVTDLPGLCEVHYSTVSDFMKSLEEKKQDLPVFAGELYLELHRGTLTQMHDIKRTNRKCEIALHDMELLNVLSGENKHESTDEFYYTLLQNQFHDILPGTCYTGVTQQAVKENLAVIKKAKSITAEYAARLTEISDGMTLYNTTSFERDDAVVYESCGRYPADLPSQSYVDVCGKAVTIFSGITVPALGSVSLRMSGSQITAESPFSYDPETGTVDTPCLTAIIGSDGGFTKLIDKRFNREVGKPGASLGKFIIAEDVPDFWDNWDIDFETMLKLRDNDGLCSLELVSNGAICLVLRATHKIGKKSTLKQDIIFYADTSRVDYHTVIDWKEKHTLLKTSFDLDINSSAIKNEIQFGHIDRPTTRNSAVEAAKFEVCNHKWSDISESRFGVALLNDCKYGISATDNNVCLTLHRGGTHPDTTGDEGVHEMTYSLYTHGAFSAANAVKQAYLLNIPCVIAEGSADLPQFIEISADNIVCEAIKPAALRDDAVVVRLYEAERNKTNCSVTLPKGYTKAYRVNFLEDIKEELAVKNGAITLSFPAFGICSVMFVK